MYKISRPKMKLVIFATLIIMLATTSIAMGAGCNIIILHDDGTYEAKYFNPCPYGKPKGEEKRSPSMDPARLNPTDEFKLMDANDDGYIDSAEWNGQGFDLLLSDRDKNGDGRISRGEFTGMDVYVVIGSNSN
ncbi:uncharacterized protein [Amphiura filiformis]|uniref:uncharacterized protein n=1 Tax=Amphiura filiformis TaxID=82378 RepID=UPI003B21A7D0